MKATVHFGNLTHTFPVTLTVLQLREQIKKLWKIPLRRQELTFNSRILPYEDMPFEVDLGDTPVLLVEDSKSYCLWNHFISLKAAFCFVLIIAVFVSCNNYYTDPYHIVKTQLDKEFSIEKPNPFIDLPPLRYVEFFKNITEHVRKTDQEATALLLGGNAGIGKSLGMKEVLRNYSLEGRPTAYMPLKEKTVSGYLENSELWKALLLGVLGNTKREISWGEWIFSVPILNEIPGAFQEMVKEYTDIDGKILLESALEIAKERTEMIPLIVSDDIQRIFDAQYHIPITKMKAFLADLLAWTYDLKAHIIFCTSESSIYYTFIRISGAEDRIEFLYLQEKSYIELFQYLKETINSYMKYELKQNPYFTNNSTYNYLLTIGGNFRKLQRFLRTQHSIDRLLSAALTNKAKNWNRIKTTQAEKLLDKICEDEFINERTAEASYGEKLLEDLIKSHMITMVQFESKSPDITWYSNIVRATYELEKNTSCKDQRAEDLKKWAQEQDPKIDLNNTREPFLEQPNLKPKPHFFQFLSSLVEYVIKKIFYDIWIAFIVKFMFVIVFLLVYCKIVLRYGF
jgi:hypothetical protein